MNRLDRVVRPRATSTSPGGVVSCDCNATVSVVLTRAGVEEGNGTARPTGHVWPGAELMGETA